MTRFLSLVLFSLLLFSSYSMAEEPAKTMPVETMQQIDSMDKFLEKAKELKLLVDSISRQKYSDCMKAFGGQKFCQCLREKSPVGIDFAGYVKVVTTTKEELEYSKADLETKRLIDNTIRAREACVAGGK